MNYPNYLDYLVFDFETGGLEPGYHEPIQVAGKVYSGRTLEPRPDAEFSSLMRPIHPDLLDQKALEINGKTREQLMAAPEQAVVWKQFVDWVNRFNPKKSKWGAPIPCGMNIEGFDLKFVDELNKLHCPKKEKTLLFNTYRVIDLKHDIFRWFENNNELANEKLDTLRAYFGMTGDGAHDALVDVRQTGDLLMKFFRLYRRLAAMTMPDGTKFIKMKDCFRKPA